MARDLFANLPGFTGHSVADAQALRARKSFAARRGEDAVETFGCTLSAEGLQTRCDIWCEAVYGREGHDGLGGLSPFARAASWTGPVKRIPDERALDALLAAPAGDGWRTVGKSGIRLDNAAYIAPEIGPLVGERVRVRHDPADPDRIFVYRAGGEFVCVAEGPGAHRRRPRRARLPDDGGMEGLQPGDAQTGARPRPPPPARARHGRCARPRGGRGRPGRDPAPAGARRTRRRRSRKPRAPPRRPDKADAAATAPARRAPNKVMAGARRLFMEEE